MQLRTTAKGKKEIVNGKLKITVQTTQRIREVNRYD